MEETISVIIPVYNIELYLEQCLDSVIDQTYRKLEIILIDDGSTDKSGVICDEYEIKDPRIIVIHQENAGAAAAKNAGLRKATGEYLAFVDGDDWLESFAYQTMINIMHEEKTDVVECAFRNVFPDRAVDRKRYSDKKSFTNPDYMIRYSEDWMCALTTNKLFRRTLFENIFFEEGHQIDDEFFTYQGVMNANYIIYSPVVIYNYRMRASSVMRNRTASERILFDRLAYSTKRRQLVVERFPELKQIYDYSYLDSLLFWSKDSMATVPVIKEIQRLIKCYFKDNDPCIMDFRFRIKLLLTEKAKPSSIIAKKRSATIDINTYFK